MNTAILARLRRHYCHAMAPRSVQRHNMRAWVRSVRMLGDKWLFAKPMERRT
jgi:hypothetical protein